MAREGGFLGRVLEEAQTRIGMTVIPTEELERHALVEAEWSATRKELDLLGWNVLDVMGGNPQEMDPQKRREIVQKIRVVWTQDSQAGAVVDLMNDFVFGRGVPRPRAKDKLVQEVIDEAWDDPDNRLVLTTTEAQWALGTDLSIQCNLFLVVFEGEDGKVKLGLLDHDTVENVVRDPDNRLRVLWYVTRQKTFGWDFDNDKPTSKPSDQANPKVTYFEHWRNYEDAKEINSGAPRPPRDKIGEGRVYHLAINRTSEMAFGVPSMRRMLRWLTAYNDFLKARVDMAQAVAAFIMKRKVKGTPNQVAKMAAKAISRRSELAGATGVGDNEPQTPPRGGSILTENEQVSHENLRLDSGASNAAQDAEMLRAPISTSSRFPGHYMGGDPGSLAGATSMELPVLKAVEARQEVFEQVFRFFIDRVIEKAVDSGRIPSEVEQEDDRGEAAELTESHEDKGEDEASTDRDLSYEFGMPSPLRRMMGDLVSAITNVARTFDPNGTNVELSRVLLAIALGEGLEVEDPAEVVERIFPENYVDPAMAAFQAQQGGAAPKQPNFFGPESEGEPTDPAGGPDAEGNPYSVKQKATLPEEVQQAALRSRVVRGRDGEPVGELQEAPRFDEVVPERMRAATRGRERELGDLFRDEVAAVADEALGRLVTEPPANGDGSG